MDRLVEAATVDAYNESDQATGFYAMMEDNLTVPLETEILGIKVVIAGIIVFLCLVKSKMVPRDGVEPPTPAFSGLRSTT